MTIDLDVWSSERVHSVFSRLSSQAANEALHFKIRPPHHIFREDTVKCLERSSRRPLSTPEKIAVQKFFDMEAPSVLVSWDEFEKSLSAMKESLDAMKGASRSTTNSRERLLAARRRGITLSQSGVVKTHAAAFPQTSSQEVGWHASTRSTSSDLTSASNKYCPLPSTDVTRGKEGRTLETYYGQYLGRKVY